MTDVVIFDLTGPFAHFRKYYTNSSSLSYPFPPRTALMGIIAAILGWPRDTYYKTLDLEQARFALVIKTPVRRLIQTVNYVRTKDEDLNRMKKLGPAKGTQVPLEILLPAEDAGCLRFRIYFAHRSREITEKLAAKVAACSSYYPLYLGLSEFIAQVKGILLGRPQAVVPPGNPVVLHSVLNAAFLQRPILESGVALNREKMPQCFGEGRKLLPPASFIYETKCRPWRAVISSTAYTFKLPEGLETVAFMEGELWDSSPIVKENAATA